MWLNTITLIPSTKKPAAAPSTALFQDSFFFFFFLLLLLGDQAFSMLCFLHLSKSPILLVRRIETLEGPIAQAIICCGLEVTSVSSA